MRFFRFVIILLSGFLHYHIYDHSFPLRGKAPKENETQVPLTQQVVIC